jgi:hypothetical protein
MTAWIVLAVRQDMDLVRADYYEHEMRYQDQIDRLGGTLALGSQIAISYSPAEQAIVVALPAAHASAAQGCVRLYRPADARLDREVPLRIGPDGRQRVEAKTLRGGLWKVRVEWTVDGREYYSDQPLVIPVGDK